MGVAGIVGGIGAIGSLASAGNAIFGGDNSATTTSQSGPPAWLQQYYQQAVDRANTVGQQPLNQYSGNMVAGFTPMQLQAFQATENAQGAANPYINAAAQYASSGAKPIYVPGGFNGQDLRGLAGQGLDYSQQAAHTNIAGAGQPGIGQAYQGVQGAQNAAAMGQQGIGRAIGMGAPQNYAGSVSQYMSPYTQNVVNATQAQFNNQNAQQQQGVIGNAITSGAWGGDRASVAQGITAGQQQLAQAPVIAGLENQGYTNAQSQLNAQQQLGLQGSQAAGQLGLSAGQLGATTGLQAAGLGQSAAQQQAALQQAAAQQYLGLYSGQQQAGIGTQEASGWLGMNAANTLGALGQQAQSSALTGAQSLYSMGSQQQQLQQQQLNIPYEQFMQQQAYPFQVAGWQANIDEGLGSSAGGTSSTTSPGPSSLGQAIGGLTSAAGYAGNAGWFGGNPSSVSGYSQPYLQNSGGLNTGAVGDLGGSVPQFGSARGGRIARADGGSLSQGLGGTGGSFGMFAQPMASSGVFGSMPKQQMASGGTPNSFKGSRGIDIPLLASSSSLQQSPDVPVNLTKDYAPPPVSSLPFTSTTFPSLTGGSGLPSTTSVTPILGLDGKTWVDPRVFDKPAAGSTPTTVAQAYQTDLGRAPDPGGLAFWSNMPLSQALAGIASSTEAQQYAAGQAGGGHANGGPVGFRGGYDAGGGISPLASGAPVGGGNPVEQGQMSQFAQMSPEKLQELAVRLPPNSPQGQMARHALQMAHSNPSAAMQQAPAPQPGMASGGRLHFADGGSPDDVADIFNGADTSVPSAFSDILGRANNVPGIQPGPDTKSIFDLIGGSDTAKAKGFGDLPAPGAGDADSGLPTVTEQTDGHPAGFRSHGVPPPPTPSVAAVPTASLPPQVAATAPSDPNNPWKSLIALGSGMLASKSPFAGVAIGEGIENQQRYDTAQQAEGDKRAQQGAENQWRNKDIDMRAQEASARVQETKARLDADTQRIAIDKQRADDEALFHQGSLAIEGQNAGAHAAEANRGYYEPVANLKGPDGKPVLDDNGIPQATYIDRYTGKTKTGPAPDPGMAGTKMPGTTVTLAQELIDQGTAKDTASALAMIHDPSGHYAAQVAQADKNMRLRAATADIMYTADPQGTMKKYGLNIGPGSAPAVATPADKPPAAAAPNAPVQITNAAEYNDLPSGPYIDPNGVLRNKP